MTPTPTHTSSTRQKLYLKTILSINLLNAGGLRAQPIDCRQYADALSGNPSEGQRDRLTAQLITQISQMCTTSG